MRKWIAVLLGLVLLCAVPCRVLAQSTFIPSALAPKVINWTITAGMSPLPFVQLIGGQNICTVDISGTWGGNLDSQGSNAWWPVNVAPFNTPTITQTTITANGLYVFTSAALTQWRVSPESNFSGTAQIGGSCVWTPVGSTGNSSGGTTIPSTFPVGLYGAKSNGVTNDSVAVQTANNACNAAGGGIITYPAGTTLAGGITFYADCQNVGTGIGATVVKLPAGANTPVFISNGFAGLTGGNTSGGVYDTGFKNMSIDGNQANQSAGAACVEQYGYSPIMDHVRIQYCYGVGLHSEWGNGALPPFASAAMINDLRVLNSGGDGIDWLGPHDGIWHNVVTYLNGAIGTKVSGNGEGLLMNGFHSWGNTQTYALYLDAGIASVMCTNCITEGATVSNLEIDGPFNTIIGQSYAEGTSATNIQLGNTHGAGTNLIEETVNAVAGQTGAVLNFADDAGKNQIAITAFCNGSSSTPATSGTQGSNDVITWTSANCTGTPNSFAATAANLTTVTATSANNLQLNANRTTANSGAVFVNNNAGGNNNQGFVVYDGGTANGIHLEPINANGIATYQFNTSAPSASCIFGSLSIRVDTGASPSNELYVCRNAGGTGVWEPVNQPTGPVQASALSNSSTNASYVGPVYIANGSSVASTYHGANFSCSFDGSQTCNLGANYWSGAAVFATAPSSCSISTQNATGVNYTVFNASSATAEIWASASTSATVTGTCYGA